MEDQDSEATRASPDATTQQNVTGPTLPAPALDMIGITEAAPVHAPEGAPVPARPKAQPVRKARPAQDKADQAEQIARLAYRQDMLENAFLRQPLQPQQEAQQGKEKGLPAPAAFLFATGTTTFSMSKDAIIAIAAVLIFLVIVGGGLYLYRHGGFPGAPATA